jgi:hypothetical protein
VRCEGSHSCVRSHTRESDRPHTHTSTRKFSYLQDTHDLNVSRAGAGVDGHLDEGHRAHGHIRKVVWVRTPRFGRQHGLLLRLIIGVEGVGVILGGGDVVFQLKRLAVPMSGSGEWRVRGQTSAGGDPSQPLDSQSMPAGHTDHSISASRDHYPQGKLPSGEAVPSRGGLGVIPGVGSPPAGPMTLPAPFPSASQ